MDRMINYRVNCYVLYFLSDHDSLLSGDLPDYKFSIFKSIFTYAHQLF